MASTNETAPKRKMAFARGLGNQVMSALNAATPYVLKGGKTALRKAFSKYIRRAVLGGTGSINRVELGKVDLKKAAADFLKSTGEEFVREFMKPPANASTRNTFQDRPSLPAKRDTGARAGREEPEDEPGTIKIRETPAAEADVSAGPSMTVGQALMQEAETMLQMASGNVSRVRPTDVGIQNRLDRMLQRVKSAVPQAIIPRGSAGRRDLEGLFESIMREDPEEADLPSRVDRMLTAVRDAAAAVLRPGTAAARDLDGLFYDITSAEPEEAAPVRRTPGVRFKPGTAAARDRDGLFYDITRDEPEEAAPVRRTPGVRFKPGTAAVRDRDGLFYDITRAEPEEAAPARSFLPGDDIAARAAALSYQIVGTRDKKTGQVIEELPDLPGYDSFQSSDGLATFFLSDDEILVATPGSQAMADWTGPNLSLVRGAASGSARDAFDRDPQVSATLETIDNIVSGYPGRRVRFVGHSKGAGVALSAYERFKSIPGRDARATVFSTPSLYFRGLPQGYVDGDRVRNYVREGDPFAGGALSDGPSFQPGSIALEFPGGEGDNKHNLDTMILRDREAENRLVQNLGSTAAAEAGTEAEVAAELRAEGDPVALAADPAAPEAAPVPAPAQPSRRLRGSVPAAPQPPALPAAPAAPLPSLPAAPAGPAVVTAAMADDGPGPAPPSDDPSGPTVQAPGGRRNIKAGGGAPRAGERVGAMLADVVDPRIQRAVNTVCHSRNISFMITLRAFIEDGGVGRTVKAVGSRGMAGLSVLLATFGSLMDIEPFVEQDPLKAEELFAQVACLIDIYTSKASTRYPGEQFAELSAWLKKNLFPVGASMDSMNDDQKLAQGLRGVVVRLDPSSSREDALADIAAMSGGSAAPGGGVASGPDHTSGATASDNSGEAAADVAAEGPEMEPSVVEEAGAESGLLDLDDFLDRSLLDHPPTLPQLVPGDEMGFFDFDTEEESKADEGELGLLPGGLSGSRMGPGALGFDFYG